MPTTVWPWNKKRYTCSAFPSFEQAHEAHVAKGHERIALQHEIIAELEREGHDTAPARELLVTFEKTQAMHVANCDRIAGKLAILD
jgi:hypothetical protein